MCGAAVDFAALADEDFVVATTIGFMVLVVGSGDSESESASSEYLLLAVLGAWVVVGASVVLGAWVVALAGAAGASVVVVGNIRHLYLRPTLFKTHFFCGGLGPLEATSADLDPDGATLVVVLAAAASAAGLAVVEVVAADTCLAAGVVGGAAVVVSLSESASSSADGLMVLVVGAGVCVVVVVEAASAGGVVVRCCFATLCFFAPALCLSKHIGLREEIQIIEYYFEVSKKSQSTMIT